MELLTNHPRAYINHGRWVADCPRPYCGNAVKLEPGQAVFHCINCLLVVDVQWPPNPDELWEVLAARPVPQTRNWFPAGHDLALASGCPHGQTVADLIDENREHGVT